MTVGFTEALQEERQDHIRPCKLGVFLAEQGDDYRNDVAEYIAGVGLNGRNYKELWRIMRRGGLECSYPTVTRHAGRECGCFPRG